MADPIITKIEIHQYKATLHNIGKDYNGFNQVYEPGKKSNLVGHIVRIMTDVGIAGEFAAGGASEVASLPGISSYLIGKSALERERFFVDLTRALRSNAHIGLAAIDVALWDLAGKLYNEPIYKLLGGYKTTIPCQASTYHGDHQPDGLSTPEAYADFAQQCLELGYRAFKIHGWGQAPIEQEVACVHAVGERVGDRMDLMLDPACEYITFGDAVKVGRACDEQNYFWYEDPYRDNGKSQFSHRKLRQIIRTPLLITETTRSLQPHIDFVLADATDYVRGDAGYDGITGTIKLAYAAEALGLDLELHRPGPVHRQILAAIHNTNYYEMGLVHPIAPCSRPADLYLDYEDSLTAIDKNGHVSVPQGPGLGVEINWKWVEANKTGYAEYTS